VSDVLRDTKAIDSYADCVYGWRSPIEEERGREHANVPVLIGSFDQPGQPVGVWGGVVV
jgi:hypothetical protein